MRTKLFIEHFSSRNDGCYCRQRELQMGPQKPGDQNAGGGEAAGASCYTGKGEKKVWGTAFLGMITCSDVPLPSRNSELLEERCKPRERVEGRNHCFVLFEPLLCSALCSLSVWLDAAFQLAEADMLFLTSILSGVLLICCVLTKLCCWGMAKAPCNEALSAC